MHWSYLCTGIFKDGRDTGIAPFAASFPELLDIGIMGHCIHGQAGMCIKAGIECYQGGLHKKNNNIPNFTSSGYGMTEEIAKLCSEYYGAVAISWYRSEYTLRAVKMLVDARVKTNIHYVLNKYTVHEAVERLASHQFPDEINAVVFLLHKPVGLGKAENIITRGNVKFKELISLVQSGDVGYKIGFDSCTVPALINNSGNIDLDSLDTCEGARWSAYISSDLKMMPCSFDNEDMRWAVDLKKHTIKEAWMSSQFEDFRSRLKTSCPKCTERRFCMGDVRSDRKLSCVIRNE